MDRDNLKPLPGFPPGRVPIIGQIEGDGEVKPYNRPPTFTDEDRVPGGLARGDVEAGTPAAYHPPEVAARLAAPPLPTKKGLPWYRQPEYLRQWGRDPGKD